MISFASVARSRQLGLIGLEDELVVDLEQHLRAQAALPHRRVEPDHRDLHAVGGGALDRHVDRHPLAGGAQRAVAGRQLRQVAAAAEQRRHEALVAREDLHLDRVAPDALVRGEVVGDEPLRLLARDLQPLGQPVVGEPVGDPVVDHLRHAALLRPDLVGRQAQDAGRGGEVDVGVRGEVGPEPGVARDVGQDAELLLRVVGAEQQAAGRRDERAADAPAERRADRDVLEVRIGARQASGGGDRLLVGRVQPAVDVDQARQRVDVRRLELRDLAVLEDQADHLVLRRAAPRGPMRPSSGSVRVRFVDGRPSSSNRIVSSWRGEPMLNSCPTSA